MMGGVSGGKEGGAGEFVFCIVGCSRRWVRGSNEEEEEEEKQK